MRAEEAGCEWKRKTIYVILRTAKRENNKAMANEYRY